jgi:hypothetical protein
MRAEHLYEFIVPFIFIMIWAVTWILNREAQTLPPRSPVREPDDPSRANRAGGGGPGRDVRDPRGAITPVRTGRTPPSRGERAVGRVTVLGPGDTIIFTESDLGNQAAAFESLASGQRPARRPQNRRPSRAKGQAADKPRARATPATPRELTQEISSSMASLKGKPLTLTPLDLPLSPLSSFSLTSSTNTPVSAIAPTAGPSGTAPGLSDFRAALADPTRLRAIFVWNELVQPPLALRRAPDRHL